MASSTNVAYSTNVSTKTTVSSFMKGIDWMTVLKWLGIFLLVGIVIACIYVAVTQNKLIATPQNVANKVATQKAAVDLNLAPFYTSHSTAHLDKNEDCLINYSPLTVQQAGFLGPKINGVYGEKDAITMALKTGARAFVLCIDYFSNDTMLDVALFGKPNEPILLSRDEGDVIRCNNAGDIGKVAQALSELAFGNLVNNPNDPLIVILHFVNTPSPKSEDYLPFLSKVAEKLQPLVPYHLGLTSDGDYRRQNKKDDIFYQPISSFEKKVLFFANVDTSGFRLPKSPYATTSDLDYLVHVTMYKQSTNVIGSTLTASGNGIPRVVVDTVDFFSSIPEDKQTDTMNKTKLSWTMAIEGALENPSFITLRYLEETLGVQSVPLFICNEEKFTIPPKTTTTASPAPTEAVSSTENQLGYLLSYWSKVSYLPKPKPIRFIKPDNFVPAAPAPQLQALGGVVQSPS